jgi:hypothetical protein
MVDSADTTYSMRSAFCLLFEACAVLSKNDAPERLIPHLHEHILHVGEP